MDSKKKNGLFVAMSLLLFAVILALAGALVYINKLRAEKEANKVFLSYEIGDLELESTWQFDRFTDIYFENRSEVIARRSNDIARLETEEYTKTHISMWDMSMLESDWYELYFAEPIVYGSYVFNTPQELVMYLEAALKTGKPVNEIYINVDPHRLYEEYYRYVYYDTECPSYEEYLTDSVFSYINDYPNVKFTFIYPIRALSYWAEVPEAELDKALNDWYTFAMYLRWWPNAEVAFMSSEEWIVANETNFAREDVLVDDVAKQVYLYLYAFPEYRITPPEIEEEKAAIKNLVNNKNNGLYDYEGFEGKKLVFYGDSIFAYAPQDTLTIPGFISAFSNAKGYNLAIGGTSGARTGEENFAEVAGKPAGRDAERFAKEVKPDDDLIFIITYGMNDYFKATNPSYLTVGLNKGIESIKERYPNAKILVAGQYVPVVGNFGTEALGEDGGAMSEYIQAARDAASESDVLFANLGIVAGINSKTAANLLEDSVHPKFQTSLKMAQGILNVLSEEINAEKEEK